jgi:hypothetical protein
MRMWLDHARMRAVAAVIAFAACGVVHAEKASPGRAPVQAAAASTSASASQAGGIFVLYARLSARDAALRMPVHEGGAFQMTGVLAAAPMVCYGDTIFRDDFDGDGF